MIKQALYDYLTHPGDLSGTADTELFGTPIELTSMSITNRNDARRYLRSRIGNSIYSGRMPTQGQAAIVLRGVSHNVEYSIIDEGAKYNVVQADVLTRSHNAEVENALISTLLKISLSGYRGQFSQRIPASIGSVQVASEIEIPVSPDGGEAFWTFRRSIDFSIHYEFATVRL